MLIFLTYVKFLEKCRHIKKKKNNSKEKELNYSIDFIEVNTTELAKFHIFEIKVTSVIKIGIFRKKIAKQTFSIKKY